MAINGATGKFAFRVNGVYEPWCCMLDGGLPVYRNKLDKDIWLEFFESTWYVWSTWRRQDVHYGHLSQYVGRPCLPQNCSAWEIHKRYGYEPTPAPSLTVTLLSPPPSEIEDIVQQLQDKYDNKVLCKLEFAYH